MGQFGSEWLKSRTRKLDAWLAKLCSVPLLQSRPETVWSTRDAAPVMKPKHKAFEHILGVLGGGHRK